MSTSANTTGDIPLRDHLDPSQVNCLNEASEHRLTSILSKDAAPPGAFLESDADEQLLLNVYFNQKVRVRKLVIQTEETSISQAPKDIKIFTNRTSIGFEDVEDADDAATLELDKDVVRLGKPINLHYVRFQNVNSLHIFVLSNQGGEDTTRIDRIEFFGSVTETTRNLSGLAAQDDG